MKIDEVKKFYCSYEIEDAVENPWKYTLPVLISMRNQMIRHRKGHLENEYRLFSEELEGVAHAAMKEEMISDQIREHEKKMKALDENISFIETLL